MTHTMEMIKSAQTVTQDCGMEASELNIARILFAALVLAMLW
jgi:hypothetical protein